MLLTEASGITLRHKSPNATLSTTNPTRTAMVLNLALRDDKPATLLYQIYKFHTLAPVWVSSYVQDGKRIYVIIAHKMQP
jgi:hypothetical protein